MKYQQDLASGAIDNFIGAAGAGVLFNTVCWGFAREGRLLARMFHELLSRESEGGCANGRTIADFRLLKSE